MIEDIGVKTYKKRRCTYEKTREKPGKGGEINNIEIGKRIKT